MLPGKESTVKHGMRPTTANVDKLKMAMKHLIVSMMISR